MYHLLRKNKRLHGWHHPLLAVDCENDPKTGKFICAGVYGDVREGYKIERINGKVTRIKIIKRIEKYFTNQTSFIKFLKNLKSNSCMLIFFNLAYDKWFFDKIVNHDKVINAGSRVIALKLKGNKIKAVDLMNHVDGSLEDWIKYLDMEKKGIKKVSLKDLKLRVLMDAKATFELGTFIEDFYYYETGIPLQVTVASSAMKLFVTKFFDDYWQRKGESFNNYEREAYFGGRVEIFKRGKIKTWDYDVNSMYLSIMSESLLPDMITGKFVKVGEKDFDLEYFGRYLNSYLGIWHVEVYVPEMNIPILPYHLFGKLMFPVGTFKGYWTSVELLRAIEKGCRIIKVYSFVYFKQAKYYFKEFADFVWDKRQKYKKAGNRGMELMIKKLGNSLYGKFAQRNDNGYFGRIEDYEGDIPEVFEEYEFNGTTYIRIPGKKNPVIHGFTAISVFITSYARIKLFDAMDSNKENVVYVDTDSIKLLKPARNIKIGSGLGEWGIESQGKEVEYFRPKMYGKKRKGVPKRASLILSTEDFEDWQYLSPMREREGIIRGITPNKWIDRIKRLSKHDNKRVWDGQNSYPYKVIEENNLTK